MVAVNLVAKRVRAVIDREGVWGTLQRFWKYIRLAVGFPSKETREYYRKREEEARVFDADLGLDTGGTQHVFDLTTSSANVEHAGPYIASSPAHFALAMQMLDTDPAGASFVDLGSGKGRALMLAAQYPFRRIIGVEFAKELDEICQQNLARFGDPRISAVWGDAEHFDYPPTNLVVFMNNPFDRPLVERIVARLEASVRATPRQVRVVYISPAAIDAFRHEPWREIGSEEGRAVFGIDPAPLA